MRADDQYLGGLGDRLRRRRSHGAAAQRDLCVLAPKLRRAPRGESAPHLAACPGAVRLRLIGGGAVAPSAVARLATAGVASADPGSHGGDRC